MHTCLTDSLQNLSRSLLRLYRQYARIYRSITDPRERVQRVPMEPTRSHTEVHRHRLFCIQHSAVDRAVYTT